jgi:hypothetical protein
MEDNQTQQPGYNREARTINIINAIALAIMILLCLVEGGGIFSFIIGCLLSLYNFISMIVYIVNKNTAAFVFNIVWMLLMPIIGFGCCAATVNFNV